MKSINRKHMIWMAILVLLLVYFSENIYGYYRFKQYCWNEGGLRVYQKLEKNVGWLANNKRTAMVAAQLDYIPFVRYPVKKENNRFYDIRYIGGHPGKKASYLEVESNMEIPVKYKWVFTSGRLDNELRLTRQMDEIIDIKNGKPLIVFKKFSYSKFDRKNTLLAAPSGSSCYSLSDGKKLISINFMEE